MKPLYTYEVTEDWENDTDGKAYPIYERVLAPRLTFNDGTKLCLLTFEGNSTDAMRLSAMFLSMAAPPSNTATSNAGGLIRAGWTNPRSLNTSTSAWVKRGTLIKVYVIDLSKL